MKTIDKIPLEAAVKFIVRERDNLKRKLEILVPYTKSLEKKLKAHENELDAETPTAIRLRAEELKRENRALKSEYKQTSWYKSLKEKLDRLTKENNHLKQRISELTTELYENKR